MSTASRVGTAVAAGYLLGRFKKLRMALIVGSALASEDVRQTGANLLLRGPAGAVGPLAQKAGRNLTGQLLEAGKSAAVGAAGNRVAGLSERLHTRAETLRGEPLDQDEPEEDEPEDEYEDEPEDEADVEDEPEDEDVEDEPEDEDEDVEEEPEDEYEDEESDEVEDEPAPPKRSARRRRTATPVGR